MKHQKLFFVEEGWVKIVFVTDHLSAHPHPLPYKSNSCFIISSLRRLSINFNIFKSVQDILFHRCLGYECSTNFASVSVLLNSALEFGIIYICILLITYNITHWLSVLLPNWLTDSMDSLTHSHTHSLVTDYAIN